MAAKKNDASRLWYGEYEGNAILSNPCNRSAGTAGFLICKNERTELYQKEQEAIQQIENKTYCRSTPTVEEYCEKWLLMQSAQIRMTTLIDYTSKVKNYIIKPLGDMHMGDVTADDIRLALLAASKKSASVYKSVNVLYKCIFTAAMESKIIDENPTIYLKKNVGGIPQKDPTASRLRMSRWISCWMPLTAYRRMCS